ncbi:5-oxoprolinase subunit B family protein [Roseovarius sp. S4756]|uniref:5-oxoprolinase subunit B family protein n=1 Tax=Roseovarius maritimus TaxID=3342637 RepID=UPI003727E9DA
MEVIEIRPLADSAVTFDLDVRPGARAAARVHAAVAAIRAAVAEGALDASVDPVGAFASMTVHYDPLQSAQADLVDFVIQRLKVTSEAAAVSTRLWRLPCCYDGPHGADLQDLSQRLGLARDAIIESHLACIFDIFAIGFLPGLPFMGELPEKLSLPRRSSPRQRVPKGSVAIAKGLCVIYPGASPGGWHIVGQCPVPLFDVRREVPALLAAGDRVTFDRVTEDRHAQIIEALAKKDMDPCEFLETGSEG